MKVKKDHLTHIINSFAFANKVHCTLVFKVKNHYTIFPDLYVNNFGG